jgi:hypothetical protein
VNPATVCDPEIVTWTGPEDPAVRRRVAAAVTAGVRRALASAGGTVPAGPGTSGPGAPDGTAWGAHAGGAWWTLPSYDAGGAPVAVPVRPAPGSEQLPGGDRLPGDAFPPLAVIRLSVTGWVWTGTDPYVTSPSLARAVQWGSALYRAQGFTVLERRDRHLGDRFVMVPLADRLLQRAFGRTAPPDAAHGPVPGLQVTERGTMLRPTDYRVVLTATGDGAYLYDLSPGAAWTPEAVSGELRRTPVAERLDPGVAARVAAARLTATAEGVTDEESMLARIVTMDREIFAVMPWAQRVGFLAVLAGLYWPSEREKKAIIELVASARSRTELAAMAAVLRDRGAYRQLFATLDGDVVDLLLIFGRARPPGPMDSRYVVDLFRELGLLPAAGEDLQATDLLRRLRNAGNGLSLWVRSTAEGVAALFTHSPAELIEGVAHLAEFALLIARATTYPFDPRAQAVLRELATQAGRTIRTALAGLEYAEQLGTAPGQRTGGARIAGDLAEVLSTALAVEVLAWFVGIGEIRGALHGLELGERLSGLLRVLSSARRLGTAAEAAEAVGRLDRFLATLAKLAAFTDEAAAARALHLLAPEHLAELARLAELVELPAGASAADLRAAAAARNALPQVRRLADALSLAGRFERRAAAAGGLTEDLTAALRRLLDTGWRPGRLAELVDAVPAQRLGEWSRALALLRPEQVEALGVRRLQALAEWPASLTFVAESGGDVYLTLLRRYDGDARAADALLQTVARRRAEIGGPARYQELLDRLARGEAAAVEDLSRRTAEAFAVRLRAGGRRELLAMLAEFEEAGRLVERDRLVAELAALGDREVSGLEHLARIAEREDVDWIRALDLPAADRRDLLTVVDDIAGGLPPGNLSGLGDVMRGTLQHGTANALQGGWGELYAVRTVIEDLGATAVDLQVPRHRRVLDIWAELPGRGRVSVEVKTNLTGAATFDREQIVKDLARHAGTGYTDLMYLYHPNVAGELPSVGERMLVLFDHPDLANALTAAGHDVTAARAAFRQWLTSGNLRVYRL